MNKYKKAVIIGLLFFVSTVISVTGMAANYYPLITVPGWEETQKQEDPYGFESRMYSKNLMGTRLNPVLNIVDPLQFGNVLVETRFEVSDPIINDLLNTTVSSSYVTGDAIKIAQSAVPQSKGTTSPLVSNYWEGRAAQAGTCDRNTRGTPFILREIEIGQIYTTYYTNDTTSISEAGTNSGISIPGFTNETQACSTSRTVYAGVDTVDNLFPGSDITILPGSYKALVRIQEIEQSISSTYTYDDGRPAEETTSFSTFTTISWQVDGIGAVKQETFSGRSLDALLSAPAFDAGNGVIKVGAVNEILTSDDLVSTVLLVNVSASLPIRDADISTGKVSLYELDDIAWTGQITTSPVSTVQSNTASVDLNTGEIFIPVLDVNGAKYQLYINLLPDTNPVRLQVDMNRSSLLSDPSPGNHATFDGNDISIPRLAAPTDSGTDVYSLVLSLISSEPVILELKSAVLLPD